MKKRLINLRKINFGQSLVALATIVLLVLVGSASVVYGLVTIVQDASFAKSTSAKVEIEPQTLGQNNKLTRSEPILIKLPSIGVESNIIQVGKNSDGTVEVPDGENHEAVGWYKYSSTPGQIGPSVFLGHYDSMTGPSIFFRLHELKIGDSVIVKRDDDSITKFEVTSVERYPKNQFPTNLVYGPTDNAEIRLVTCGGEFNREANDYEDNVVVLGKLIK